MSKEILIVGGGLSGLTLAYLLSKRNIKSTILEVSPRLGGRIQTLKGNLETPLELGATWFSDSHPNLLALISELGLQKYPQFTQGISLFQTNTFEPPQQFFVPQTENTSYRLAGGTQILIDRLAEKLNPESIQYNTKVIAISEVENKLMVETSTGEKMYADKVILCMPPQLAAGSIRFSPELPSHFTNILTDVHTWMVGSVKFVVEYKTPFWREKNFSGMLFSHVGIVSEMHDHTNFEENKFGFTGFLNPAAVSYSQKEREKFALQHIAQFLGKEALTPTLYSDKIWIDEYILAGSQIATYPRQNNGHPFLQQSYFNNKLFFSATECATAHSGYMEGAVIAAMKTIERL